jgi:hypothetical protein
MMTTTMARSESVASLAEIDQAIITHGEPLLLASAASLARRNLRPAIFCEYEVQRLAHDVINVASLLYRQELQLPPDLALR